MQDTMNGPKQEEVKAEEAALAELEQELQDRSGFPRLQIANHFENQNNLASFEDGTFNVTNSRVAHLKKNDSRRAALVKLRAGLSSKKDGFLENVSNRCKFSSSIVILPYHCVMIQFHHHYTQEMPFSGSCLIQLPSLNCSSGTHLL